METTRARELHARIEIEDHAATVRHEIEIG
jgi:hypothetical protein